MTGQYLFALGLVPVQAWIAASRRSRDLRSGSVLLWHLMAKVLWQLQRKHGGEILLPREDSPDLFRTLAEEGFASALSREYGIPNRATGTFEAGNRETAERVLAGCEEIVRRSWARFRDQYLNEAELRPIWDHIEGPLTRYRSALAEAGDCPFSLVWAAIPLAAEDDPLTSRHQIEEIDRLYADVKRTRPLNPWPYGAPVGKCNQCGRREAMGPEPSGEEDQEHPDPFQRWRLWHAELSARSWVERGVRIDRNERLCYVCLARRLAGYAPSSGRAARTAATESPRSFPSTGEVAAAAWLQELRRDPTCADLLTEVESGASRDGPDLGRFLYLTPRTLRERGQEHLLELRTRLDRALDRLNENRSSGGQPSLPSRPPSYLALFAFDGDSMGQHLRADPEGVSLRLETFAHRAHEAVTHAEAGGVFFYLAGDEGLGMVPAATALDTALSLRRYFTEVFGEGLDVPTLSMGVAFFEQSRPMDGAIRVARERLADAKDLPGKDALGVSVETASGSRWRLVEPWGSVWDRLSVLLELIESSRLSSSWAYDVEQFLQGSPSDLWQQPSARRCLRAEVRRLFFRRITAAGATHEQRLAAKQELWRRAAGARLWEPDERSRYPQPRPEQFHLLGFLARQVRAVPAAREGA